MVLSPFTGSKKAWNKTREKYMPEEIWQNLAEWLEKSLDDKGEFYNDTEAATGSYLNNSSTRTN